MRTAEAGAVTGAAPRGGPGTLAWLLGGLLGAAALSLLLGAGALSPRELGSALAGAGTAEARVILWEMRVPRTVLAVLAGAALGVAGTLMQALTRNPLADPGLLGVNAGAGLAVVLAVGVLGVTGFRGTVWYALAGALLVSALVFAIGLRPASPSPLTLVLTGVAVTAVLLGITNGLALLNPGQFNAMRGWMAGSVQGKDLGTAAGLLPFLAVGAIAAAALARPLRQLGLGDDLARSLGVRVGATRLAAALTVTVLAGAATAAVGPITFLGLMVPHLARALAGGRLGRALLLSAPLGALLLLLADLLGRAVLWPAEAPAGLVLAVLGAPVLVWLIRGRGVAG